MSNITPASNEADVLREAIIKASKAILSMKVESETAAQGDEQMMLEACEQISNEGLAADMAIRAALADAAAAGLGAWQPIKTAPKDGTTAVDLWFPKSGRRTEWRWFKKGRFWGSKTVGRYNKIERCFDEDPTHWMPLPEAPNT